MKKIIIIFISVLVFLFISVCVMVSFDKNYINDIEEEILDNTDINNITYINKYDNSYIVMDKDNLYLLNSSYEEIYKVKISLLYENKNNYDLVYRDNTVMYMDNYKNKDGLIFKYYDVYTYELIDEVIVGGNYE